MALLDHVNYLSVTIGPRGSTTENERKAAEYVRGRLEALGIPAAIEEFKALPTYSWLYVSIYAHFLAAALLMSSWPVAGAILCVMGLFFYVTENSTCETLGRLFPKRTSWNVVGQLRPAEPARKTVVLSAHIDSSKSALFFHPALVKGFRNTFVSTIVSMLVIFGLCIAASFINSKIFFWLGLPLAAYIAVTILLLVHREVFGRHTHGAVDNASGVAAMLGAAEAIAKKQPGDTEIIFVGTGAEETGLYGMVNFLKKNHLEKEKTKFVNVDHVGIGNLAYTAREGMILRHNCDAEMIRIAKETLLPNAGKPAREKDFSTMLTDLCAALYRGYSGISIMAFHDDGALPNWHWETDVADAISEENLQDAASLAAKLIIKT